jgi:actin-like protein 6A
MSYAGDDVGAVVGDLGSTFFRYGNAGTALPDFSTASTLGHSSSSNSSSSATSKSSSTFPRIGEVALYSQFDDVRFQNPFVGGALTHWEDVEQLWTYAFSDQALGLESRETPVVATAPSDLDQKGLAKYLELLYETLEIPSGYVLRKAVASSFAAGKTTSLVVDSGAQGTIATTVCEGFVLHKTATRTMLGGDVLDSEVLKYIESTANAVVRPRFHFSKKRNAAGDVKVIDIKLNVHDTVLQHHRLAIARDLKETHCSVPHTAYNEALANTVSPATYELPDGTKINLGTCRYVIPEMLMNPSKKSSLQGIPSLVLECLSKTPVDIRRETASQILLAGGSTCFDGFSQRLNLELTAKLSSVVKVRQHLPSKIERKSSGFTGGSILASLGSFQQLWVSKKQYDEGGAMVVANLL